MNRYISTLITVMLIFVVIFFIWIFPANFAVEYTPKVSIEARTHVESFNCTGFGDVIQAKFEIEQEKYDWLDFEAFANDYNYIAELSVIWDFNTCFCNQTKEVKLFIKESLK